MPDASTGDNTDSGDNKEDAYNPGSDWFTNIWNVLSSIPTWFAQMANSLNPLSDKFILKGALGFLGDLVKYLNPMGEDFILTKVINFLGNLVDYINPFSENFILKKVIGFLANLVDYINPFSDKFILKIAFVMSSEQEEEHKKQGEILQEQMNSKLPIVGALQSVLNSAVNKQKEVRNVRSGGVNPIKQVPIPSYNFSTGAINIKTPTLDLQKVVDAYEPYRVNVRDGLCLIVYALGIVYLVKYILNYGVTQASNTIIEANKNGGEGK